MATWPSGKAEACKAFTPGSNPGVASKFLKELKMRYLVIFVTALIFFSGCSNTWHGVKEDTNNAYQWSKDKVHDGAEWVGEKTK